VSDNCLTTGAIPRNLGGMPTAIRTISAEDVKGKLDRGEPFRLVNALPQWEFDRSHIPGSEHFPNLDDALNSLKKDDEIVVYCTDPPCRASQKLYKDLVANGYDNVRRFEGGLVEWARKGYPLDGETA
jgi:rhodanese-related sulfurtransferase